MLTNGIKKGALKNIWQKCADGIYYSTFTFKIFYLERSFSFLNLYYKYFWTKWSNMFFSKLPSTNNPWNIYFFTCRFNVGGQHVWFSSFRRKDFISSLAMSKNLCFYVAFNELSVWSLHNFKTFSLRSFTGKIIFVVNVAYFFSVPFANDFPVVNWNNIQI